MRKMFSRQYWTGPRCFAAAATALVVAIFIGANVHLVLVAFASKPDCVLQTTNKGAAIYRAAKPSC